MSLMWMGFGTVGIPVPGPAEVNAPSLWSGGIEWGDAETPGAIGYWQTSSTPTERTGKPAPSIAIGGRLIWEQMNSGSWTLGRSDWMSTLSPNTASFSFVGVVDCDPNDTIVVALMSDITDQHSDALWVGRVDSITVTQTVEGAYWTNISATDIIGVLGEAKVTDTTDYGYTLKTLTEFLATEAGLSGLTVETSDTLPELNGVNAPDMTALAYINRAELTSNALMFMLGNGHLRAVIRQARAGSVVTTPLDAPTTWTEQVSLGNIVNFISLGAEGDWGPGEESSPASIALYGERRFSFQDMLTDDGEVWGDIIESDALATPRAVVTSADFPVSDLSQPVLFLDPLDWITHDATTWQVMSVQHNVSLGDWRVNITADQTQNFLLATPDPTPTDPPNQPDTTTITKTYTSAKAATVAYGGTYTGNGAGDYLAVGLRSGVKARALIGFPIPTDWEDDFPGFIEVIDATLTIRTSTQVWVPFGSNPQFYVQRLTSSWNQGTFTGPAGSQYDNGNAVVWPGPDATTTGQKLRGIGTSENNDIEIAITAIAQGWHDHGNDGLRLKASNEDSTSRTTEFFSNDYATSGHRPTLRLKCRVTA